ncbi:MAG TPA: UDP-N-acetylmuramate dehydrogenase [Candidatus Methylomirabilis sp.]|nr:UDP-N-acetylmuramate dehydrogenase [Candidatus Methylomirabilis sp.]
MTRDGGALRVKPLEHVSLASYSTMGVGGPARWFVEALDEPTVLAAVEWAEHRGLPLHVLGGGSNVIVADDGVDGLVLHAALRGVTTRVVGSVVDLTAAAGEPWDELVRMTVERGWAGLECLSGIPGLVGATPIQNVGAYGQDVSETIVTVRALDRRDGQIVMMTPAECEFSYRDSVFKSRMAGRYVVLGVGYRLQQGGAPALRYPEVVTDFARQGIRAPTLADVRRTVLAIRRSKSMVLDERDPNRRSCGSFFVNPVVAADEFRRIEARVGSEQVMPSWPEPGGRVKLSAAWLIEHAGFARGHTDGAVGLSTRHALAIVCHPGARARDVVAFARRVRARVEEWAGVRLTPEPEIWGPLGLD